MTDLDKLIYAVERGEVGFGVGGITRAMGLSSACGIKDWSLVWKSYHGSLDAAKALHDALLPGYDCSIDTCEGLPSVTIWGDQVALSVSVIYEPKLARAWLLAILKAYRNLNA